jgi:hypothetical protein
MPGVRRKVRKDEAEVKPRQQALVEEGQREDTDQDLMYIGKDILVSPELEKIKKLESRVRDYLVRKCVPCLLYRRGVVLVSIRALDEVYTQLRAFKREMDALVEEFLANYPLRKAEARLRLGPLYREKDYPTEEALRTSFDLTWRALARGVPQTLREFRAEIFREEQEKVVKLCQQEYEYVRQCLRIQLNEMVNHLVVVLTPNDDGSKKVFKNSTVEKMTEFLSGFEARNITDDGQLGEVVDRLKGIMQGVDAKALRESNFTAQVVRQGLEQVQRVMEDSIVEVNRAYNWD